MNAFYSPQQRAERVIGAARAVLATFSLLAISLDPSTPTRYVEFTYTVLSVYLIYALLLMPLVWRPNYWTPSLALIVHGVDLLAFSLFLYLTEGTSSPFFVYFIFALLSAALRWQWRGALWTALLVLVIYVGLGVYTTQVLHDQQFELNRFIIRSIYLVVVAMLLGYMNFYEEQLRGELLGLAAWPRGDDEAMDGLVQTLLQAAARLFKAPRLVLVWEEADEPWCHLAACLDGEFRYSRHPPGTFSPAVAEALEGSHFLCPNVRASSPHVVLHASTARLQRWQGPLLHPALTAQFDITGALVLHVRGEHHQGYLMVLDGRGGMDELTLGAIIVRQIAADLDRFYVQQRLHQAATMEERMRLARDLHDGVLQTFAGTLLQLDRVRHLPDTSEAARQYLADIQALLVLEQQDLRSFVQQRLKPDAAAAMGTEGDLAARLKQLGERIGSQWRLQIDVFIVSLPQRLSVSFEQDIYRLVHEALINAARHAHASRVEVRLTGSADQIYIEVADNGRGFPFRGRYDLAALIERNLGPVSLRERLCALRGDLVLESWDTGSRLEMRITLNSFRATLSPIQPGSSHADPSRAG